MKRFLSLRATLGTSLAILALIAAGCSDDDSSPLAPMNTDASFVRVAHLSPDAPAVDVWVDGSRVLQSVPFKAISDYIELTPGDHVVQVVPAGATDPKVIDATVTLAASTSYTVAARGLLASIAPSVLADDRSTQAGNARVRFVHTSPDAPAVDITLTDGTVLFGDVSFTEAAEVTVPAGTYDLQVRAAGTSTVVLSFGDVALQSGTAYSVFAIGTLANLTGLVAVDSGTGGTTAELLPATAEVRVAHLSPDAPNVDVWVDGAPVAALTNVAYQAVSGYLTLPARTTSVQVFVASTTTNPVIEADLTLDPNVGYTVAATGLVGSSDLMPIVLVDDRTPAPIGNATVRFVHTSPDAPAVDIVVAGGATLFSQTSFRQAADYLTVPAGTYDLEVRLSSNQALALSVPGVALGSGTNYSIFAIGLAGNATLGALPAVDAQ